MSDRGIAHMGVGVGKGENRVIDAVKEAIGSPLLETSIDGAKAILLNIMGGYDLGMLEANEAADLIEKAAARDANIIFGASIMEDLEDEIRITVIATGFDDDDAAEEAPQEPGDFRSSCVSVRFCGEGGGSGCRNSRRSSAGTACRR